MNNLKVETKSFTRAEIKDLLTSKNLLEFNREINQNHVNKMAKSIQECGILRLPVIGDVSSFDKRKHVIVDGQHLSKALIDTYKNGEFQCIVKKYESKADLIKDVAKLNKVQKKWDDTNFLNAWHKYGKDNVEYYANYNYLWYVYTQTFDGLPIGYMIDLYAKSKGEFKEGRLEFRDSDFSDKVAQVAYMLSTQYQKPALTLHGLRIWAFNRRFQEKKDIDFVKLTSRLQQALKNNEDKYCNSREDFAELVNVVYTRI